jgi:hypothetical protein
VRDGSVHRGFQPLRFLKVVTAPFRIGLHDGLSRLLN